MSIYQPNFNIRQGLSEQLFEADGFTPKASVKLELGCWYLCIDTVCVYVCIEDADSKLVLKKINVSTFEELEERIDVLENEPRYVKINNETELPKDFTSPTFNPKTAYYIVTDEAMGFMSLYIFDEGLQGYICTNKAELDFSDIEKKLAAVVEDKFDEFVDSTLDTKLEEKVPSVIKTTMETQVLFGGNSTATTADDVLR